MGFIEGGTAVLFAIVMYAIFYAIVGMQVRNVVTADEEPIARVFGFLGISFVALMVWGILGGFVYWVILIWFRIWLRDPHPWRQEILSTTGWFPFGFILKHGPFPVGAIRGVVLLFGFPVVLQVAAGIVALILRVRDAATSRTAGRSPVGQGTPSPTKEFRS